MLQAYLSRHPHIGPLISGADSNSPKFWRAGERLVESGDANERSVYRRNMVKEYVQIYQLTLKEADCLAVSTQCLTSDTQYWFPCTYRQVLVYDKSQG